MSLSKSCKAHFIRLFAITVVTLLAREFVDQCDVECNKLISLGVVGGIMALGSFLINARNFIVFKLHEHVYSNAKYQKRTRELMGIKNKIYIPLLNLDEKLGNCIFDCAIALIALATAALFGKTWALLGSIAIASIFWLMFSFMLCVLALNRNFQSVIQEWNANANE